MMALATELVAKSQVRFLYVGIIQALGPTWCRWCDCGEVCGPDEAVEGMPLCWLLPCVLALH